MKIDEFSQLSLAELQSGFQNRSVSPSEVMELVLDQIEATHDQINALYGVRTGAARKEARAATDRYAEGRPLSPFDGVPVTIKDSVNAVDMVWHHGSKIHGNGVVAQSDSPPVKRLKAAGAIIVGKGAMPDFGLSASGVSGSHGIVRNPWGLLWNTGGSSAGGSASVAAGIAMMSVGSDIAGSVRLPAGHCGLAALKPTQGVIPHTPASTVRSAGPITRRAADLHAWAQLLSGPDDADRYSMPYSDCGLDGQIRVGATCDFGFGPETEPAVESCFRNVCTALEALVGEVRDIDQKAEFDAFLPIDASLKLRGWREYINAREELRCRTPEELHEWFREAEGWTSQTLHNIETGIERGVAYCVDLLSDIDVLVTPVMPIVNFPAEQRGIDPSMPLRHTTFTSLFNQAGNPAVSICGGFDERGLPIGVQLVGKRLDDARVIRLAAALEAKLDIYGPNKKHWPTRPVTYSKMRSGLII